MARPILHDLSYARCAECGSLDTRWERRFAEKDRIAYRSRKCFAPGCGLSYKVVVATLMNPTLLRVLENYHDAVEAGAPVEEIGHGTV
jgi:hypothetical protein